MKLGEKIINTFERENGSIAVELDFSNCPSQTDTSAARETDLNYLIQKFKPDELAAYMAAKAYRQEILNHDFSSELSLQDAKNEVLFITENFKKLKPEVQRHFPNALEFLKFVNNPTNKQKLVDLGLATKKEIAAIQAPMTTRTQDAKDKGPESVASSSTSPTP